MGRDRMERDGTGNVWAGIGAAKGDSLRSLLRFYMGEGAWRVGDARGNCTHGASQQISWPLRSPAAQEMLLISNTT